MNESACTKLNAYKLGRVVEDRGKHKRMNNFGVSKKNQQDHMIMITSDFELT
jgi:hypothetical protein